MSKTQPLQDFFSPNYFHNHGDNPTMKKFLQIAQMNAKQGKILDHRTYVIDRAVRFLYARQWQDFLQRDLKAITFPRAFAIFTLNTMAFITVARWTRKLLPIGRFGIRKISETSFYNNFGPIGVAGASGLLFAAAYTEWKTFKFTLHKFYRHVILGDRNWIFEGQKGSRYGMYQFSDNPLANENTFPIMPNKLASLLKRDKPTYGGPYQKIGDQE